MSESTIDLDKIATRIRNLLAKAEATTFSGEAALFRAKAEELQHKYRIAEEALIASDASSVIPIFKTITITRRNSPFYQNHLELWRLTARHTGCRSIFRWETEGGERVIVADVVGYASDIRYAEYLYQSAWLVMVSKLEPKIDPTKTDAENVYALRSSGLERNRVAQMMWGADLGNAGHAAHAKVGKLYKAECLRRGEDPIVSGRSISVELYRETFASGFEDEYGIRLVRARDAADLVSGGLVLHGRKERVAEAFYEKFPELRPETAEERAARQEREAAQREREAAEGTHKKPRALDRRRKGWTQKDQERWDRLNNSATALAGRSARQAAASEVELLRGKRKPGSLED